MSIRVYLFYSIMNFYRNNLSVVFYISSINSNIEILNMNLKSFSPSFPFQYKSRTWSQGACPTIIGEGLIKCQCGFRGQQIEDEFSLMLYRARCIFFSFPLISQLFICIDYDIFISHSFGFQICCLIFCHTASVHCPPWFVYKLFRSRWSIPRAFVADIAICLSTVIWLNLEIQPTVLFQICECHRQILLQ